MYPTIDERLPGLASLIQFVIFTEDSSITTFMIHSELQDNARLATIGLWLSLGIHCAHVLHSAYGIQIFDQLIAGRESSESALVLYDELATILLYLNLGIFIFTAFSFVRWMLSAYDLLVDRGMIMPFDRTYASLAFFIPIVNLVRPYQVVSSIFDGVLQMAGKASVKERSFVLPWWLLYIFAGVIGNLSGILSPKNPGVEEYQNLLYWDILVSLMFVGSAWLFLQIIEAYGKVVDHSIENDRINMIGVEPGE